MSGLVPPDMQDCWSSLAASLESLAHCRNVSSLSRFYRYYFSRCFSELAQLIPPPFSQRRSTHYSDRLHDFSVNIPGCYKDVYVNSFFPCPAKLWNTLPIECFPSTYDLSSSKACVCYFVKIHYTSNLIT